MAGVSLKLLVLKTRQVECLRTFCQALGVELTEERHGNGPLHFAGQVGDTVLEIYPLSDEGGAADTTSRLGFAVEKPAEVVQTLCVRGPRHLDGRSPSYPARTWSARYRPCLQQCPTQFAGQLC